MNRPRNFEEILAKFPDAKQSGDYWAASCPLPGHKTPAGHITLKDAGDKALITCQGGRHEYEDFCEAWGYDSLAYSNNGNGCQHGNTPIKQAIRYEQKPVITSVDITDTTGITITQLAEAKHLDINFLKSLGISDFKYSKKAAIRIPYYNSHGQEVAIRFRLALEGDGRFKWRTGDKAMLYGLSRLPQIKKAGWVLLVEGESDCWTCWAHDIPALGVPGKGIFPVSWGEYLEGLDVYIWQEPGAEDFTQRIFKAAPHCKVIISPKNIKDISDAHVQGENIVSLLEDLKAKAIPVADLAKQLNNTLLTELFQKAKPVIESTDPLTLIENAIRAAGYGGDIKPALITYLSATSRLLAMREGAMPVHLLLSGPTSAGKSYTLRIIKRLLPPEAYHEIEAGSPRVLIYDGADLQHRLLIFGEADSLPASEDNPCASAIRNLLQDHNLHYMVTIKDKETGDFTVRSVDKPGPTVLITTSTKPLGDQLNSRFFTLECSDTAEQIAAALGAQAKLELGENSLEDSQMVAFQSYLQLKVPWKVLVPFAKELAAALGNMKSAPRILRDFARLISLIKVVALLRHHNRETDGSGRIIAKIEDYDTIRLLIGDMYIESSTGTAANIRQLVEAVQKIDETKNDGETITNTTIAKYLAIGITQIRRRAKKAMSQGWLVNREQRKSYPANYEIGEPMPPADGLPILTVDMVDTLKIDGNGHDNVFSFDSDTVDTLTPLTDGKANADLDDSAEAQAGINGNRVQPEVVNQLDGDPPRTPADGMEMESCLIVSRKKITEFWVSKGCPDVILCPGEKCEGIEQLLSNEDILPRHIEAINKWFIENGGN